MSKLYIPEGPKVKAIAEWRLRSRRTIAILYSLGEDNAYSLKGDGFGGVYYGLDEALENSRRQVMTQGYKSVVEYLPPPTTAGK